MFIILISSLNNLINKIYFTLNDLIIIINKHAKNEDYTIRKRRFKSFKKNVFIKIIIICDAYNKTKFTD